MTKQSDLGNFLIPRHAEFISASLRFNEVLKQVQDDDFFKTMV